MSVLHLSFRQASGMHRSLLGSTLQMEMASPLLGNGPSCPCNTLQSQPGSASWKDGKHSPDLVQPRVRGGRGRQARGAP